MKKITICFFLNLFLFSYSFAGTQMRLWEYSHFHNSSFPEGGRRMARWQNGNSPLAPLSPCLLAPIRLPNSHFPLPEQGVNPHSKETSKATWKFQELDRKLLKMVESQNLHPVLDYTLETVSLISPFIEGGLTLEQYVKACIKQDKSLKNLCIIAAAALIGTQIVNVVLKYAIARDRPDLGTRNYRPRLLNTKLTPSFPSGHTASSFAFANIMGTKYAKYKVHLLGYAGLSGYSQMYVGNHYPSDVFAGALLGYSIGEVTLRCETVTKLFFKKEKFHQKK